MASQEGQVCASCAGFNLAAAFDPDQFETLPRLDIHSLGTLESVHPGFQDALKKRMQNPSPEWIRCVGSWNPPDPNNSDIRSGCSFCALLIDMAVREPSVLVALPSHMLYDIAETSTGEFTCSMPENSLLVISKPLLALRTGEGQEGWKDWVLSAKTRLLRHDTIDHDVLVNWLATCIAQHGDECTPTAGPPVPKLKLIDCRARRIINVLPEQKYEYVALSYVWGIGPLEPYIYPMLPENLPLVIRDAMALVLRLGYQYLWVDRYCIWQDEPDQSHKMSQVNKMNQIYGGALLTIYACAGEEPNYGLPGVSTRQRYDFQLSKIVSGMTLVTNRGHHAQIKRISTSRWKSRGWTFQEEALSRRRLYITDYQASFVCSKVTYFEHLESPLSFSSNTGDFERPFWNGINVPYGIWPIISQYSSRQLTYQGDRINAITGVLNQWSQLHPNCFHYWGVPVVGAPSCWRL
ncbi:heterokaryon incompatibility protein-domain-containing protein, partial [Cladorrhinum samala]